MPFNWRNQPPAVLESHFNPRAAVGHRQAESYVAKYEKAAAVARERLRYRCDIRYGLAPKQTLDLFLPKERSSTVPAVIFIHGGYWRAMDKSGTSHLFEGLVSQGIACVSVNYDLCPDVTLDCIVEEMHEMLRFVHRESETYGIDPGRIFLSGHSAGAHLSAMLLGHDWSRENLPTRPINGACLISGIYETEVVRKISVNADVRLTEEMARRNNCLINPPHYDLPIIIAVGEKEPKGWIAQSELYKQICLNKGINAELIVVPGCNHFDVLTEAIVPSGCLNKYLF